MKKSTKYKGVYTYEHANGDVSFYVTYKSKIDNKKIWVNVGKNAKGQKRDKITLPEANAKREELKRADNEGISVPLQRKNKLSLDDLAKTYFEDKEGIVKSNAKNKGRYESNTSKRIGRYNAQKITQKDIIKLQNIFIKEGKAPATINWLIQQVGAIYNHAIKRGDTKENPCTGLQHLKLDNARNRFLTLDELDTLCDSVKDNADLFLFTKISITTGARLETVMHICKKDIDFRNKIVSLHDLKNGTSYKGFFGDSLSELLKEHTKKLSPNDRIIQTSSRIISRKLKSVLDRLFNQGLDPKDAKNRAVIHTLRHSFASNLAIKGTPLLTIKTLLNHRDIRQTMRYAKLSPNSGKDAVLGLFE